MIEAAQALWLLVAALGLALPVSYAGLPVLGQGAFVAVGALGTAQLGPGGQGLPLLVAAGLSVLLAAALGLLVALGASRLEGATLALATWALAWLVWRVLVAFPRLSGGDDGLVRPSPAHLVSRTFGLEVTITPLASAVTAGVVSALVLAVLVRLHRGPAGLDLAALREGPDLASTLGLPVAARRRAVLTVSAALGGLSGAGTLVLLGLVAPADLSPLLSLQLVVAVLVGGAARWWGPLVGVGLLTALPHVADRLPGLDAQHGRGVVTAGLLVVVLALRRPFRRAVAGVAPAALVAPPVGAVVPGPVLLSASDLHVAYGGVTALDGAGLELRAGEVHALLGPNGSGKSTLLRVLAGSVAPQAGTLTLEGAAPGAGTVARVRAGVVRTPQATVVLPGQRVGRQVALGRRSAPGPAGRALRHLAATPSSRRQQVDDRTAVVQALDSTGLGGLADADAARLPVGAQRLLQVARAVATGAPVLLLDEPAAGMTTDERTVLQAVLRHLAGTGRAVLLVEHDVRLVGAVADTVTVLDAGQVIYAGPPSGVRSDPQVRRAYLG